MHRVTSDSKRGRQIIAQTCGMPGNGSANMRPFMGAKQIEKARRRAAAAAAARARQ